jgi:hypothetical protein
MGCSVPQLCWGASPGATHPQPGAAAAQPESQLMQDGSLVLIEDVLDDDDASTPSSPQRPALASGLDSFLVCPSAHNLSSSLSPSPPPCTLGTAQWGCSKARHWADEDSEAERSPVSSPTSYLDAVRLGSQLRTSPLLEHTMPHLIVRGSHSSAAAERGKRPLANGTRPPNVTVGARSSAFGAGAVHGQRNHRTRRPQPRPELVACLLDPWRATSLLDSASDVVDGAPLANTSPLRTPTTGVRSCRRSRFVVPVGHAPPVPHRLFSGPLPAL